MHAANHSLPNTKICPSAYISLQYASARKPRPIKNKHNNINIGPRKLTTQILEFTADLKYILQLT